MTAIARRAEPIALAAALLAAMTSFWLGFMHGENGSGGAIFDFVSFHWRSIKLFSRLGWGRAVMDYPSATNPLIYMLASLAPWSQQGFRTASTVLAAITAILLAAACHMRLQSPRMGWLWCSFAGGLILLSPAFRATAFWGNTDPFPFFFATLASIQLSRAGAPPPLLLPSQAHAHRSILAETGLALSVAVPAFCAFYTRQFYAFVPLVSAWMLLTQAFLRPAVVLGVFALAAMPELLLLDVWHGFNPPTFHKQASPAATNILLIGANVALFALPLAAGSIRRSPAELLPSWWRARATAAYLCLLVAANIALRHIAWPDAGGGLLVKAGLRMGTLGTPFIVTSACLGLTACVLTALRSATNALLVCSFLLPFLIAYPVYERYFDPSLLVALLLFAGIGTSRRLFTPRVLTFYFVFSAALLAVSVVHFRAMASP